MLVPDAASRADASEISIRPMADDDLLFAAQLEAGALPHGLFPKLGAAFLRRYLATYARSDHAVAMVAERHGELAGFIVGTLHPTAHRQETLRRHGPALVASAVLGLLRRPRVAVWFLRTRSVRYAAGVLRTLRPPASPPSAAGVTTSRQAVLNHVAVHDDARGHAVGSRLVECFLACVQDAGLDAARLVTLAGGEGAGPFYERLGWDRAGGYHDQDGVAWARYQVQLS